MAALRLLGVLGVLLWRLPLLAAIPGVSGTEIHLVADEGTITTPDGAALPVWGFAVQSVDGQPPADGHPTDFQYPGPTLLLEVGQPVTITLENRLEEEPTSLVFPGQLATAPGGGPPPVEVAAGGTAVWTLTPDRPGTFLYQSGTRPEVQVPMGLVGAMVVRPAGLPGQGYDSPATAFDEEFLLLLTEIDPRLNLAVAAGQPWGESGDWQPRYWFLNGRAAPDTMADPFAPWLPNQPYDCMPMIRMGDKALLRMVGAGRDLHPFHTHGNHGRRIARDAWPLVGTGPDRSHEEFTFTVVPGQTVDVLFSWTGADLGWDIFGHTSVDDPFIPGEDPEDHGRPFPVVLPEAQNLTLGDFYSGSPFLGDTGELPPGHLGLNDSGAWFFMWHSHAEREMVNNDVFPGGMMTMLVVLPPLPEVAP